MNVMQPSQMTYHMDSVCRSQVFFMETHHAGEDVSYLYCIQNSVTSMGKIRENQLSDIFGQIGHMGPRTGYLIYCFRNLS